MGKTVTSDRDASGAAAEIAASHKEWLAKWMPKLTSNDAPLNPYRVLWDLQRTVDIRNTIITHDAGSPRDQLSPFWKAVEPLSYIGWGKTTQLGYGLGLAMGAKLAKPDKLCINVWGDAAIGFTGMDFETAVREKIPILSILLNNFSMAIELKVMPISTEKYRATDISGDYAAMARAFGGYGERVEKPGDIVAAIKRGIAATEKGQPALLEFITSKEVNGSRQAIAVTMVQWTGPALQVQVVPWMLVNDEASMLALAAAIEAAPRQLFGGGTSISGAIDHAMTLFPNAPYRGARRVIDVSGDGRNNRGRPSAEARDEAVRASVTINGLPILTVEPDLEEVYRD